MLSRLCQHRLCQDSTLDNHKYSIVQMHLISAHARLALVPMAALQSVSSTDDSFRRAKLPQTFQVFASHHLVCCLTSAGCTEVS